MSKKMTPCEKLGYKVGDKFKVVDGTGIHYAVGSFITLIHDDGSSCPRFNGVHAIFESGDSFFPLDFVEKVAKIKPAKQALADAIHQNGGWPKECHWMFAASNGFGSAFCWTNKPKRSGWNWLGGGKFTPCCEIGASIPNWHQCVLSRDEYFTAYPEQAKVEVKNETKNQVEVEMKSESEMTINASDWHKNGELPPVGEVCIFDPTGGECYFNDDELKAKGHQVCILAHTKYKQSSGSVAVFKWDLDECCGVSSANACSFRPLRTERDKAIEEMVKVLKSAIQDTKTVHKICASALYNAGYRKEVK